LKTYISFIFFCIYLAFSGLKAYGQCSALQKRVYAGRQESYNTLLANISSAINAIDGNPKNHSSLNVTLGALNLIKSTQYLEFRKNGNVNTIAANTPVTIKMSLPKSVAGVLDNVVIQPFTNLNYFGGSFPLYIDQRWTASASGAAYTSSTLVNAINGAGEIEITIKPTSAYQGVWITLGSVLGLGMSSDIFHAYIMEDDESADVNCDATIDVLSGVKAGTVVGGIANATGSVSNPWNAIDNDLNSFATLSVGAQLLSEVFETVIFNSPSQPNDVVEIILQKTDGGLLDLDLLTGFTIQAYNGTTAVGSPINSSSTGLGLNLLSGTTGNAKYLLKARIDKVFDRVEIKMGGLISLEFTDLKIYDVKRKISPDLLVNNAIPSSLSAICEGKSVVLSVNNPQSCTEYSWYDVASGGTPLATGTSYTIANVSADKTYYVEATRENACNNTSGRMPADIIVNAAPSISLGTMPEVCLKNNIAIIPFDTPTNFPESYKITWNQDALDANFTDIEQNLPASNEINVAIPPNTNAGVYAGSLTVKNSNGCYSYPAQAIQIIVKPQPAAPELIIQTHSQY